MKTFKQLYKRFDQAITKQEKEHLRQERDYLQVATNGGRLSRVGDKRLAIATKGVKLLKKLNRLVDYHLILDNDERLYTEKKSKALDEQENKLVEEIKKTLKPLGISVAFNTYAYLYNIDEGKGSYIGLIADQLPQRRNY